MKQFELCHILGVRAMAPPVHMVMSARQRDFRYQRQSQPTKEIITFIEQQKLEQGHRQPDFGKNINDAMCGVV